MAIEPVELLRRTYLDAVARMTGRFTRQATFWNDARGWAPPAAATLLRRARLDRTASLADTLRLWAAPEPSVDLEGQGVLAWTTLGALAEAALRMFLYVFANDYAQAPAVRKSNGSIIEVEKLQCRDMLDFYDEQVWVDDQRRRWSAKLRGWIEQRNAIHLLLDRELRPLDEFRAAVIEFDALLGELEGRLPYPDLELLAPPE